MKMSPLKLTVLVILVLGLVTISAAKKSRRENRRGGRDNPGKPIDEILAKVGNLRHGKANPRGRIMKGLRRDNETALLREYDILIPTLDPTINEGSPPSTEKPAGKGGRGRNNRRNRKQRRNRRNKRHATPNTSRYWPNGEVPYWFDSSISQATKDNFAAAISEFNSLTCIQWKLRTTESDYVLVKDSGLNSGCYSYVGRIGGPQTLNLEQIEDQIACTGLKTIIHEMLHALGVYHQHTRADRDTKVTINLGNAYSWSHDNFLLQSGTDLHGTPYDYRSIMHYSRYAFSENGSPTVQPTNTAFNNIIGFAPTIGFHDVMLITRMYSCTGASHGACPSTISCPSDGFLGHDCTCKCETDSGDYTTPVMDCGQVCNDVNTPCECDSWASSCDSLPNSSCNSITKACECVADYVKHNGACTLISSIQCSELNVDCKCGLQTTNPCQTFSATCDTNMCTCSAQQVEQNGACVDLNSISCDEAGKVCGCSSKGSSACSLVDNSSCNTETDACVCNTNYYADNGACSPAPSCSTLNSACHCEVQDEDACSTALANTVCNTITGACECPTSGGFEVQGSQCILIQYISDGSVIAPFTLSSDTDTYDVSWQATSGADNSNSNQLGIQSNNHYLSASGNTGNAAGMETGLIDATASVNLCVRAGVLLNKAKVTVILNYGNGWVYWSTIPDQGHPAIYFTVTFTFPGPSSDTTAKFTIKAEYDGNSSNESWNARLDPLLIEPC